MAHTRDIKLAKSIAPFWSATSAYEVGDVVMYKRTRYVCKTAVAEGGESWDASKWTAQTVQEALTAKDPPSVTLIKEQGNELDNTVEFIGDAPVSIFGTGLAGVTADAIRLRLTARADGRVLADEGITATVASAIDTAVTLSEGLAPVHRILEDEVWAGAENKVEVVVTIDGNEYAKEITLTL